MNYLGFLKLFIDMADDLKFTSAMIQDLHLLRRAGIETGPAIQQAGAPTIEPCRILIKPHCEYEPILVKCNHCGTKSNGSKTRSEPERLAPADC
jgi:hypothetical protein